MSGFFDFLLPDVPPFISEMPLPVLFALVVGAIVVLVVGVLRYAVKGFIAAVCVIVMLYIFADDPWRTASEGLSYITALFGDFLDILTGSGDGSGGPDAGGVNDGEGE